jgi:hypothetical protein
MDWEKSRKNLIQDSRSPGRNLSPGPHKHEAGAKTTRPGRSEFFFFFFVIPVVPPAIKIMLTDHWWSADLNVGTLAQARGSTSIFKRWYHVVWCRGSSGSIVSDYELDDRAIGVRSPAEVKDFSSNLCVQTGSGAHPASCTMGTGGGVLSPGVKRGRGVMLTTHPHLVPRSWMSRNYTSSPPKRLHGV